MGHLPENLFGVTWKQSPFLLCDSGHFEAVIDELHIFYGLCVRGNQEFSPLGLHTNGISIPVNITLGLNSSVSS